VPTSSTYAFAERLGEPSNNRIFSFIPKGIRQENLYKLNDNTYQIDDPRMEGRVVKVYYGGHNIFLDATEVSELTAAGYGDYIT
jgi:hypothetical protein